MFGLTIPLAVTEFFAEKALPFLKRWWIVILAVVVIIAVVVYVYVWGYHTAKAQETIKAQAREIEVQGQISDANSNAADARLESQEAIQNKTEELQDVTDEATRKSATADDLRRKRGCVILRQQGRDTSRIAACR